jgi:hypothetical protein
MCTEYIHRGQSFEIAIKVAELGSVVSGERAACVPRKFLKAMHHLFLNDRRRHDIELVCDPEPAHALHIREDALHFLFANDRISLPVADRFSCLYARWPFVDHTYFDGFAELHTNSRTAAPAILVPLPPESLHKVGPLRVDEPIYGFVTEDDTFFFQATRDLFR